MSQSSALFGNFRLFTIETGHFRMDGGAMFGVVPKTLWSRYFDCDEKNRIRMTARSLLVHSESSGRVYLIDSGTGHKFDEKFSKIYDLDFSKYSLAKSLSEQGFTHSDITDVIFTHLHFDHCGGAVTLDRDNRPALMFPNARHWVHKKQWDNALNPNIRERASYLPENIGPLSESGMIREIDDNHVYEPGFKIHVVHGHSSGQQLPLLTDGNREMLFAADLLPGTAHLPQAWVMAFDVRPLLTFDEKKEVFSECIQNETLIYLEHDPNNEVITLADDPTRPVINWSGTLDDL